MVWEKEKLREEKVRSLIRTFLEVVSEGERKRRMGKMKCNYIQLVHLLWCSALNKCSYAMQRFVGPAQNCANKSYISYENDVEAFIFLP